MAGEGTGDRGSGISSNQLAAGAVSIALIAFAFYLGATSGRPDIPGEPEPETPVPVAANELPTAERWAQRHPRRQTRHNDDEVDLESFFVEAPEVVLLGWGWSIPRAETIPTVCVEFDPVSLDNSQDSTITIKEVRDSYALSQEMDISGSVSVNAVGYSGTGKASFAMNADISSDSVSFLVTAEVMNSTEFAGPRPREGGRAGVRLTPDAATLARERPDEFQEICGEGYVSARKTGARAYLLATTKTTTQEDRQSVRTSVEGEGWGVKVNAAANGSSTANTENFERTLSFYQQGGSAFSDKKIEGIELPGPSDEDGNPRTIDIYLADLPATADEAIARIKKLAQAAAEAERTFEIQITPYQVLDNFPRGLDLTAEDVEYDEIAALWGAYATIYSDLRDMLENPKGYAVPLQTCAQDDDPEICEVSFVPLETGSLAIEMVEAMQDMALIARDLIEANAVACLDSEERCDFDPSVVRSPYSVRAGMPVRIPTIQVTANNAAQRAQIRRDQAWRELQAARDLGTILQKLVAYQEAALAAENARGDLGETVPQANPQGIAPEDHLTIHLREPSQGRCIYGAQTPGCISNAEIRAWAARTGLMSRVVDNPAALRAAIEGCADFSGTVLIGDGDDPSAPVIWHPASVDFGAEGQPLCTSIAALIEAAE